MPQSLVEIIGRSFERVLRWAYPGILFITLLALGKPEVFDWWMKLGRDKVFVGVLVMIIGSIMIYGLYRYLIAELTAFFFDTALSLGSMVPTARRRERNRLVRLLIRCFGGGYWVRLSWAIQRRFGYTDLEKPRDLKAFSEYVLYFRAVTHVLGMTFWTFVFVFTIASAGSSLRSWWIPLWIVASLCLVAGILQTLILDHAVYHFLHRNPTHEEYVRNRWVD